MPKLKETEASRVVRFFRESDALVAQTIFGLVAQIIKDRSPKVQVVKTRAPKAPKPPAAIVETKGA